MKFTVLAVLTLVAVASGVEKNSETAPKETVEQFLNENEEGSRDKRGFLLTPLTALPASAIAPLLPFLRAVVPPPILAKIAPLLPTAPIVDASSPSQPTLPGILTATAPLLNDRKSAVEPVPSSPLTGNVVVAAQRVPVAPAFSPVVSAPASAPVIVSPASINFATTVSKAQAFPPAPPVVPRPALLTTNSYIAHPSLSVHPAYLTAPFSQAGFPTIQYFGRNVFY